MLRERVKELEEEALEQMLRTDPLAREDKQDKGAAEGSEGPAASASVAREGEREGRVRELEEKLAAAKEEEEEREGRVRELEEKLAAAKQQAHAARVPAL